MRKIFMFLILCFIVYSKGFCVVPWTQPVTLVGVSTNNPVYDSKVEAAVDKVNIECLSIDSRLLNVISTRTEVLDGNMVRVMASTTVPIAEEYSIGKEYKVYMASFTETSSTHTYKKSGVLATKIKVFTE
ncbi:MAG: hypothetical protein PHY08_09050, partial [Candidatus Cloacimonetes bacterium]|nr:hypothetical protein [Candidatus Cloacimonadota bacterium]